MSSTGSPGLEQHWRSGCLSRDPWFGLSTDLVDRFLDVLMTDDGLSGSTCAAYHAELHKLDSWMQRSAHRTLVSANDPELRRYLVSRASRSTHALSRALRSMRRFYEFLQSLHCREDDPSPRPVDIVLCTGSANSRSTGSHERDSSVEVARDLRDRIVGSLVSTTGLRVTDLLDLRMGDLFLHSGYMMAGPVRRSRMILLSARTVGLMQRFLEHSRPALLTGRASTYVFPSSGFLRSRADSLLSTPSVRRR